LHSQRQKLPQIKLSHFQFYPNGCVAKDSVKVIVNPLQAFANDVNVSCGKTAQLNVSSNYTGSGILTYLWSPSDSLNSANISNPVPVFLKAANYSVEITTPNGCKHHGCYVNVGVTDFQPTICMLQWTV